MTASPSSKISVFAIPTPASDEHVTSYSDIRLSILRTNPESFGATYEGEAGFTREQWHARVNLRGRTILVARAVESDLATDNGSNSSSSSIADADPNAAAADTTTGLWVGTLSVLGPEVLASIPGHMPYPPEIAHTERTGDADLYMLVGMWVHPEYRGRGVGRLLIERAFEVVTASQPFDSEPDWEKEDPLLEFSLGKYAYTEQDFAKEKGEGPRRRSRNSGRGEILKKDRVVLLRTHDSNSVARSLYGKAGFVRPPGVDPVPGQSWMVATIHG